MRRSEATGIAGTGRYSIPTPITNAGISVSPAKGNTDTGGRYCADELWRIAAGAPRSDGPSYDPAFDQDRLSKRLGRVFDAIREGAWLTLQEIADATGDPPASISAQLRHLRKPRFGGYTIEKRRRGRPEQGLFEYRLVIGQRQSAEERLG